MTRNPYVKTADGICETEISSARLQDSDAGFVSGCEDDDSSSGPAHSDDSGLPPIRKKRPRPLSKSELEPSNKIVDAFRPWGIQTEPLELVKRPKNEGTVRIFETPRVPPHPAVTLEPESPPRREHRNYKNMTRERRIEANARERTRVHTISAAFDTLRTSIPSYSTGQKLSKLSVLRVACAYIAALSSDLESNEVDNVTDTIHSEGKLRKKKDET